MSFTFEIDRTLSLSKFVHPTNRPQLVIEKLANSKVEACGANFDKVIGNIEDPSVDKEMMEQVKRISKERGRKWMDPPESVPHGLMQTVHMCYAEHYPLILSPDHVWLAIAQGFAHHVNLHSEELRKRFVQHEGKKLIMIQRDGFVKGSPDNDWQGCFSEFSDKIADHLGKKRDLVVSNFSTTGPLERAVSEIVLMDAMKSYFKYACCTVCGIPSVTLLGTEEDWVDVYVRAENLAEYGLDWWVKPMAPVLEKIAEAANGTIDYPFWKSIYKQSGGSGGPYCSGWINVLFPYLEGYKGEKRQNKSLQNWNNGGMCGGGPTMDQYPAGMSKLPFKWEYYTKVFDMEFLGGFVGTHQDETTLALTPALGWAVRDQGTSVDGPLDESKDW